MLTAYRYGNRYVAARVRVNTPADAVPDPKPLHLAFLLDTSGSMEGERLNAVLRTLWAARDLFTDTDRVTLVCFDDSATTVATGLLMNANGKDRFYERIERIRASGCTNLSAGLERLLTEQNAERPYTALVVLTDGHINRGVTSNAGLQTMIDGLSADGQLPVTALGYGADHNRMLLRDIALRTRGAYTYVDSDETLPVVMGDLMAGLRATVLRQAVVAIDGQPNWVSAELYGSGAQHVVGDVVADREYWVVFENPDAPATAPLELVLNAAGAEGVGAVVEEPPADLVGEVAAQVFRCRVAAVSAAVTTALEQNQQPEDAYRVRLTRLQEELTAATLIPLVLRLRAQVAELLAAMDAAAAAVPPPSLADPNSPPPAWGPALSVMSPGGFGAATPTAVLARLSSATAQLSLQRGVSSVEPDSDDPTVVPSGPMFSSPVQLRASTTCRTNYRGSPSS